MKEKLNRAGLDQSHDANGNRYQSTSDKRRFVVNSKLKRAKRKARFVRFPAERVRRFVRTPLTGRNIFAVENSFVARRAAQEFRGAAQ